MGQTFGVPGGSLVSSEFGRSTGGAGRVGVVGEQQTGRLLYRLAQDTAVTVLHDVRIPGSAANVDHVLVSGSDVLLVDSKLWAPGFYWTIQGRTFRGLSRFGPGDKKTLELAQTRLEQFFERRGVRVRVVGLVWVVWPSGVSRVPNLLFYSRGRVRVRLGSKVPHGFWTRIFGGRVQGPDRGVLDGLLLLLNR